MNRANHTPTVTIKEYKSALPNGRFYVYVDGRFYSTYLTLADAEAARAALAKLEGNK